MTTIHTEASELYRRITRRYNTHPDPLDKEVLAMIAKVMPMIKDESKALALVEKKHGHCPHKQIVATYNRILGVEIRECRIATDSRKAAIRRVWAFFNYEADAFEGYFKQVKESDFLCGRASGKREWKCDFDWLLKQKNIIKVIEGSYTNG